MEKRHLIKIKNWIFDPINKTLTFQENEDNKQPKVETLESKHVALLSCLIEHQGSIVSREQLVKIVWKDRYVDDRTINATISRLRKILGGETQEFIKTHPKSGYSLHCVASTISVKQVDQSLPDKSSNISPQKKFTLSLIIFLSLLMVWYAIEQSQKPLETQTETNIEIIPLTYEEGWEFEPSLNADGNLLAYVTFNGWQDKYKVHVQNNDSKNTKPISTLINTRSPIWLQKTNQLFYVAEINGKCVVQKTNVSLDIKFSNIQSIAKCGDNFNVPHIALSEDGYWLYYLEQNKNQPSRVKRVNLKTKESELLTNPPSNFYGDFDIALNNDDSKLAFIRYYDDMSHSVVMLNLNTGEQLDYTKKKYEVDSVAWSHLSDKFVFTDDAFNTLFKVNSNSAEITSIFKSNERLSDPFFVNNKKLLISKGDPYKSNIGSIELINNQLVNLDKVIHSSFKDHSAIKTTDDESLIFVSNRSGSYELWKKSSKDLKQLTHFNDPSNYISEPLLLESNSLILFKLNNSYMLLDLDSEALKPINFQEGEVRSITKDCSSKNKVLLTIKSKGEWYLNRVVINTLKSTSIMPSVTSVKENCDNNEYIVTRKNKPGLFILSNHDMSFNQEILSQYTFESPELWAINGNYLFFWENSQKTLNTYNLLTQELSKLMLPDKNLTLLSSKNKKLYFSDLSVNNTFIGEVTMSISK
ncbi:winged helix-turn-helix domain-containing protein [Thalassotalea hakodatensis]|uniref:winged helix-turn-helix domain-containing protein n=1 Tax=Thalassotalea hakodatensis TaxID=3030492 RepID=UPI0025744856|nr:winged helix-turn-helix domain-containing protein [Thalassotalea hakodatensis]